MSSVLCSLSFNTTERYKFVNGAASCWVWLDGLIVSIYALGCNSRSLYISGI